MAEAERRSDARTASGTAFALLRAMRPIQWTKNAVLLAALVFAERLFVASDVAIAVLAALVFCALSSGIYLLNDVRDAEQDRLHPVKRLRPIAAGDLQPGTALLAATVLLAGGLGVAWSIGPAFAGVALAYVSLMVAYSLGLKALVLVDVFAIAAGFVLRAVAGAVAIDVRISPWLLACTLLLALFLAFGKRRHELASLPDAALHRRNLESYTLPLLDQLCWLTAAATVACYTVYVVEARAGTAMILTVPVVAYAVFRYLFLMHRRGSGGRPETTLLEDWPLLGSVAVWGILSIIAMY
jgi:4-hydroxybenzoate polyprenyltransferase